MPSFSRELLRRKTWRAPASLRTYIFLLPLPVSTLLNHVAKILLRVMEAHVSAALSLALQTWFSASGAIDYSIEAGQMVVPCADCTHQRVKKH